MKRAVGILCAGLLIVGGGCAWTIGNTRVEASVRVNEQAVDATLESAAAKVQAELQRRGLEVTVNPAADSVRVVSKLKSGDRFTVVLSRLRSPEGKEQTKLRVEWDAKPNPELWQALLGALAMPLAG